MTVLAKKKTFLIHADGPTTKLIIGNIPISATDSEIERKLKGFGMCLRSPFKEKNL